MNQKWQTRVVFERVSKQNTLERTSRKSIFVFVVFAACRRRAMRTQKRNVSKSKSKSGDDKWRRGNKSGHLRDKVRSECNRNCVQSININHFLMELETRAPALFSSRRRKERRTNRDGDGNSTDSERERFVCGIRSWRAGGPGAEGAATGGSMRAKERNERQTIEKFDAFNSIAE